MIPLKQYSRRRVRFLLLLLFALRPLLLSAATPSQVLVVVNDASPASRAIGKEYARKRHVDQLLHLRCKDAALSQGNETLKFQDYLRQIETPLRAFLQTHPSIDFIVMTRGMPIRISGASTGEAYPDSMKTSLDSYVAALDYDKLEGAVKVQFDAPKDGAVGTAWENRYWNAQVPFSHAQFGGYLVTRLEGYTTKGAQRLTTRALAAERRLKKGTILLDVQPEFGLGDKSLAPTQLVHTLIKAEDTYDTWNADMERAHDQLVERKIPAELDLQKQFVGNRKNLLGYFSWGSNDSHFSQTAYRSLSFLPGAIGETGVSTSARSFFPQTEGQSMIADLIAQGITGVKGYTDEPLLQAVASPSILLDRYTSGWTLAESFYAASRFVGWTDMVVGDPLAHPYRPSQVTAASR